MTGETPVLLFHQAVPPIHQRKTGWIRRAGRDALQAALVASVTAISVSSGATAQTCIPAWTPPIGIATSALGEQVNAITVFDDGSGPVLYAGGKFAMIDGVPVNSIAKWDGVNWSPLGSGITTSFDSGFVNAMTVFDDGSGPALYVGGIFTMAGGVSANNIAKWDGATWSSLGSGIIGGFSPQVDTLTIFDDGTGPALYVGGFFATAGGAAANNIAKWDGVSWSALSLGLDSRAIALTVFDDGSGPSLYAGGTFSTAGGSASNSISKWNGVAWSPLGVDLEPFSVVSSLMVFDDGFGPALYAGGEFFGVGVLTNGIAKWDGAYGLSWVVECLQVYP